MTWEESMTTITQEQRQEIEQAGIEPVRVEDPVTGAEYFLIRADVYRKMRELVEIEHIDRSLYEYQDYRPLDANP
jgi:hypothetical protein